MRLLFFILFFPFYLMGQDKQGPRYLVTIADSSYETIYIKTYLSGFVQAIIKKGKEEELKIKTNIICDTSLSEAYMLNPRIPASLKYIVNCFDYISFIDTLGSRSIIGLEKLINNEIFIFKDSLKIILVTIDVCLFDENRNTMCFNNKTFAREGVREFIREEKGNIYVRILKLHFNESDATNIIEAQIGFRLEK